jgi:hypothetical protein
MAKAVMRAGDRGEPWEFARQFDLPADRVIRLSQFFTGGSATAPAASAPSAVHASSTRRD